MSDLKVLSVEGSQVADLSPLTNLTELVELHLSNTQVRDFLPATTAGQIGRLECLGNACERRVAIGGRFGQLEGLVWAHTKVEDLSPW